MKDKNVLIRLIFIILGTFIYAVGTNIFITPHKLLSGGVAGISLMGQYVTKIPSGYWVFIINIPLFIIGYKKIDLDFILYSAVGAISVSVFLVLTKDLSQYVIVKDINIATLFGSIVTGYGLGLIFKYRASLGGTDIIMVIIRKNTGADVAKLFFLINGITVLLGTFVIGLQNTLYTLVLMYVTGVVMERVMKGFDKQNIVIIVTEKEKEVSDAIMEATGRGTTYLYGEGGYTGNRKKIIYCLMTNSQLNRVKKLTESIDSSALISISQAQEIKGNGFFTPAI
ncbi:YitT family protein [Haloimpatiens lingqiaonensis]|uniref:YitT family protein n=1 Tax=Haloimpatiens lingqiaonensis TaxID=1380675 RepID=UPI001485804E|nr:YitT family protein [Haloimpatiens lingqiaonensis]